MDQGADRGRALHCVGQPDVEGHLGRLPHGPQEQEHCGYSRDSLAHGPGLYGFESLQHAEAADLPPDEQDAHQEPDVADTGDNKCLFSRLTGRGQLVPEPDQKVGTNSHQLPGHVQQQEAVGHHDGQHRGREHGVNGEVPPKPGIAAHVTQGVDLHQEGDEGHQPQHRYGEGVDDNPPIETDAIWYPRQPGVEPTAFVIAGKGTGALAGETVLGGGVRPQPASQHEPEDDETPADGEDGQQRPLTGNEPPKQYDQRRGGEAEYRNQPSPLHQGRTSPTGDCPINELAAAKWTVERAVFTISSGRFRPH